MTLTAEAFRDIVDAIRTEEKPAGDERQKETRAGVNGSATIIPVSDKPLRGPMIVNVCDLSLIGLGFRHSQPLHCGKKFILFLPWKDGKARGILYIVVRWQPVGQNVFEIGATFEQGLEVARGKSALDNVRELERRMGMLTA